MSEVRRRKFDKDFKLETVLRLIPPTLKITWRLVLLSYIIDCLPIDMTKNNSRFLSTPIILLTFSHLFNNFYASFLRGRLNKEHFFLLYPVSCVRQYS
jgi:hypothetical protein